jgi:hypothetical protein
MGLCPTRITPPRVIFVTIYEIRFTGPNSIFPGMTVSLIRYLGLTAVSPSSGEHEHCLPNKSVWHPCIWMALPLNGTTLWSGNMASCRGPVSQSSLIFALVRRSDPILWVN